MLGSFFKAIKAARVMDYYNGAKEYVLSTYVSPVKPQPPTTSPSENDQSSTDSGERFSREIDPFYIDYLSKSSIKYSAELDEDYEPRYSLNDYDSEAVDAAMRGEISERSIADLDAVLERAAKPSFVDRVIEIIREKGVRDSVVYKAAQIDRRLFSKIMSDKYYKPAKDTAIAIALALQLPLAEANDLLERAGYILSHSNKRDIVIEYFIRERMYSLNKINSVLEMLYLKPIGR